MKKLLLISLMMLSGSAWAEWTPLKNKTDSRYFYDPTTIRREGQIRRVWTVQNLIEPDRRGVMSRRMRVEYDCKNERYNLLSLTGHSEPMAGGKIIFSHDDMTAKWDDIPPNTAADTMLKIVCAK